MSTLARAVPVLPRRRSLAARIWAGYELGRSRARLRELPDYLLEDIGVTQREAQSESHRSPWDVPGWWRR